MRVLLAWMVALSVIATIANAVAFVGIQRLAVDVAELKAQAAHVQEVSCTAPAKHVVTGVVVKVDAQGIVTLDCTFAPAP